MFIIEIKTAGKWNQVAAHENWADAWHQMHLIAAQNTYKARMVEFDKIWLSITPKGTK